MFLKVMCLSWLFVLRRESSTAQQDRQLNLFLNQPHNCFCYCWINSKSLKRQIISQWVILFLGSRHNSSISILVTLVSIILKAPLDKHCVSAFTSVLGVKLKNKCVYIAVNATLWICIKILICDKFEREQSSLHWPILSFFYVLFVQCSLFPT